MIATLRALLICAAALLASPAFAQGARIQSQDTFQPEELVQAGHSFFGTAARGIALTIQEAFSRWGAPNGYILGQEGAGAIIAGLRYGEGVLTTRNAGQLKVFWQGPSVGFDLGGDGARTMMLVYKLPYTNAIFTRFLGLNGSAYFIGGFGMSAAVADEMIVVPIRAGVGVRLGVNIGYLKFTPTATWNPF